MSTIFTVKMPDIGEGVVEGEIVEWLKKIDDSVQQDEPVVIIMTDKATVELPSPYPGKLVKQYFAPGQMAQCDRPLYDIETSEKISSKQETSAMQPESINKRIPPSIKESRESCAHVLAAPPVRKLAHDLGLDIETISGTGKNGIVTVGDLKQQVLPQASVSQVLHLPEDEEIPLVGVRKLMARKMKTAKVEIPHFSYFEQVEATRLIQLRQNVKEQADKEKIHLTYMPFFIKALSLTIQQYPMVNSMIDLASSKIVIHKHQNIGIAISTATGLIVPVLKYVENMPLIEIIKNYEALKQKAKERKLLPQEMKEATITISNFGVLGGGGLWATPIINYPEVAILAIAKIQKQPVIKNETVVARDVINLSWSFDHRVIDGDLAASISHTFSMLIQNPAPLL
jgi:pyruvate dehydrogenase E2 component (dihydrolipoamide acetyltransferase)